MKATADRLELALNGALLGRGVTVSQIQRTYRLNYSDAKRLHEFRDVCFDVLGVLLTAASAAPPDPPGLAKCRKFAAENPRTAREIGLDELLAARQSDPPGLVQLVVALIEAANRRKAAHGVARVSAEYDEAKAYEALLACDLSAPASPAPDWQPIETAPTDGTPILVADATSVEEGVWQPETEDETECGGSVVVPGFDAGWWGSEWQPGAKQPTHWMRMPKPPSSPAPMPTKGDK